jgi:hypothetical protein
MGLGVDRFPKVDFPMITVTTVVPGAAPEQVETEVSDRIESAVNTLSGVDELRSVSVEASARSSSSSRSRRTFTSPRRRSTSASTRSRTPCPPARASLRS